MITTRLSALGMALIFLIATSCNTGHNSTKDQEKKESVHENEQDGMEAYMEYKFRTTKDPALNYVPSERLAIAQAEAQRRSSLPLRTMVDFTWTERGPSNVGGRTRAILIDKNDLTGNTVFAGSVGGGIWKCTDFKTASYAWTKTNDHMENLAVSCIAQDPVTPTVMYAGTGEGFYNADAIRGGGIFKSVDGGTTWTPLPSTIPNPTLGNYSFYYVQDIVVAANGDVYATGRGYYCNSGGVFKSTDGGATWAKVVGNYTGGGSCANAFYCLGNDLEIAANGDLYVTTGLSGSATASYGHVFKSPATLGAVQGDVNQWTEITPTPPTGEAGFRRIELACAPSSASTLYVLCQKYNDYSVTKFYKSSNKGLTWTAINVPSWCDQGNIRTDFTRGQAWYDLIAAYDPANPSKLFIGGVDVMKSVDGGNTFTQATRWSSSTACGTIPIVHADIHNITFMNGSSSDMIISCDGGIFYSADGGATFTNRNSNYNVTQYYSVAVHPAAGSNYMLAGAQDNGSHKFTAAGINAVTYASGGDGANCYIDQVDPNNQITSYVYANYYISRNGGNSFSFYVSDQNGDFINPGDYDSRAKLLYCGYTAGTYGRVKNIVAGTPLIESVPLAAMNSLSASAFKVDPNTLNRIYIGISYSSTANLLRVDNANATPAATNIYIPGAYGSISSIDVEDGDANHLLVTLSNYGITSVYESTDGGTNWNSIEGDLPDMPVNWGIFLPSVDKRVALATEVGVWTTATAAGLPGTWLPDNTGMANVSATMLRFRKTDSTIAVATHGRGVFTTSLGTILPLKLISFAGSLQNQHGILNWKTASESNTSHFEIEKSFDGQFFTKIGNVKAAGNSNTVREYGFADKEIAAEASYYRLKMVDTDGKSRYSHIVLLKNNAVSQAPQIVNNPFKNYIDIRFAKLPAGEVKVQLANSSGSVVQTKNFATISQNVVRFNVGNSATLSKGVYVVTIYNNKEKYSRTVVKE